MSAGRVLRLAAVLAAAAAVFLASAGFMLLASLRGAGGEASAEAGLAAEPGPEERVNVLLLGVDLVEGTERSDTIMVLSLDPLLRTAAVLSIPRDTLAALPGRPTRERIGHAHAYGGPAAAVRAVSQLLGVPIHHHVKVKFQGFVAAVDALGGVTLDVEQRMRYSDPAQGLEIDLQPGRQHLDGERALQFVRYRLDGDLNRIRRQQQFLRALMDQAFQTGTVLRLPAAALTLSRHVETSLRPDQVVQLAQLAARVKPGDVEMAALPVRPEWTGPEGTGTYLGEEMDPVLAGPVVDRLLRGIDRTANARVRVRVVDASGSGGRVRAVQDLLAGYGYAVVGTAVAPPQRETRVLHPGDQGEGAARLLARTLAPALGHVGVYRAAGGRDWEGADLVLLVGTAAG